jgi:hypothetical protein
MAASLRDEDLQPVMLNSIALSGAAIQTFSNPLLRMHCYGSKWITNANKKIIRIRRLRVKMFYFLLLHHLYQLLQKSKADNTCLSITIVKYSLRKAACSAGKNDTL